MTATTQCPTCNTRFKVTREQLDSHQGLVRCGRCQAVFNAALYFHDDEPSPQLDLPIAAPAEPAPALLGELDFGPDKPAHAAQPDKAKPALSITQAQKFVITESPESPLTEPSRKRTWSWFAGSLLLLIVLLAQAAYFFRTELAVYQPGIKPALISYCHLLQCDVPLPQKADLMSIESSDLEADPAQSSVIALNALMRNQAPHVQAYPFLELTLTDGQDNPLARRTFRPKEYLKTGEDENQGIAANREISIKINLDTTDLKPSGYRLFLFYPQ
ncbi:MAG: zinc-ribbon and DUF3426 domain-containing protein [Nitrosomonadales bacterium]